MIYINLEGIEDVKYGTTRDEDVNPDSATGKKRNTVRTKIELSKLREFRIVGNIGAENGLEYEFILPNPGGQSSCVFTKRDNGWAY